MNRLILAPLFAVMLSVVGCGGDSTAPTSTEPSPPQSQNPDLPAEVREEFKREEDLAKKAADRDAARASKAAKH